MIKNNELVEQELLEIEGIETDTEKEDRFIVDSIEKANWCFRKLKAIEEKENEIKALAKAELDRIKEWESKELKTYEDSKGFFQFLLEEYYRTMKDEDDNFKLSTPYGKVTSRKQQPKFIRNDEKLLEWVKKSKPELVKVSESTDWAGLKKELIVNGNMAVTEEGEVIDGIEVVERDYSVTIKVE